MDVRYATGEQYVVVGESAVAVLDGGAPREAREAVWLALRAGGGVAEVLQGLIAQFAANLPAIPGFAVVARSADGVHVAVRGPAVVRALTPAGPVDVSSGSATMWNERLVSDAVVVDVVADGKVPSGEQSASAPDCDLPLESGVVLARSVRLRLVEDADVAQTAAPASEPALEPEAVVGPAVTENVAVSAVAGPAAATSAVPSERLGEPVEPREAGESPVSASPEPGSAAADSSQDSVPARPRRPAPAPARPPRLEETMSEPVDDGGYDHLYGPTVFRRVEDAAIRGSDDDEAEVAAGGTGTSGDTPPEAPPAGPAPLPRAEDDFVPVAAGRPGGMISDVPGFGDPYADDHDGETIMSAELEAIKGRRGHTGGAVPNAPSGALVGPTVLARVCAAGHANSPQAVQCRTCAAGLTGDAVRVSRPSLGRIRLSTGPVIELDSPIVLGRKPTGNRFAGSDVPRLESVPSPNGEISKTHLAVRLEEWHVLVADLGSSNGTMLLRPGQGPRRLDPNDAQIVVSGDVVDLGDGATLTFEDLP